MKWFFLILEHKMFTVFIWHVVEVVEFYIILIIAFPPLAQNFTFEKLSVMLFTSPASAKAATLEYTILLIATTFC